MSGRKGRRRAAYSQRRESKAFAPRRDTPARRPGQRDRDDHEHVPYQTDEFVLCRVCWVELE